MGSGLKVMMASSRLRNSGVSPFRWPEALVAAVVASGTEPDAARGQFAGARVGGHDQTTLRKSALRPMLSVSVALSMTCRRMLNRSGCAFSISSSSSTV